MARRIVGDILARLADAATFPEAGAPRDHIHPGLRMVMSHRYSAYYLITPTDIAVVRILHGARDVEAIADEGGFA